MNAFNPKYTEKLYDQIKNSLNDEKLADKFDADDKEINDSCGRSQMVDDHQEVDKSDYEDKRKELEGLCMPIMTKLYSGGGGGMGMPGGMPDFTQAANDGGDDGPQIDEVD